MAKFFCFYRLVFNTLCGKTVRQIPHNKLTLNQVKQEFYCIYHALSSNNTFDDYTSALPSKFQYFYIINVNLAIVKKMPYIVKDGIYLTNQKYTVFDNLIEGVQVLDYNWRYYYVNETLAKHGNSTIEAMLGNTMLEKYPGIEKTTMFKSFEYTMFNRLPTYLISEYVFNDGTKKWFELSIQPVPEGIIILSSEITKLKKTEEELKRKLSERTEMLEQISSQKKQLEEFCQIISHNLRAPLSNLFLLGEMLAENHSLEDKFFYFEMQKPIIAALQQTFEELVDAAQVKKDLTIKKNLIDLDKVFTKVKKQLEEDILGSGINISSDFTEVRTIFYSKKYIQDILTNLLSNAIRYRSLQRTSKVHVCSYKKDGWIYLEIKDNGLGIDMRKNREHVFKLHKTFHNHPKAKGFGLFITKIQVEALGGSINVKSIVDQGSTFTIKLYKTTDNEKN